MSLTVSKHTNTSILNLALWAAEPAAFLLFISLMYKLTALGLLSMMVLAICGVMLRQPIILNNQTAIFSVLYVFLATVTAYFLGFKEGTYRTIQFILIVASMIGLVKYWYLCSAERQRKIAVRFSILIGLVFTHLVLYHLLGNTYSGWKTLYDTKTTISLILLVFFYYLDHIRLRTGLIILILVFALLSILVVISGERKAYLLLAMLFAMSTVPLYLKAFAAVCGTLSLILFLLATPDGSYVKKQLNSALGLSEQAVDQYEDYRYEDLETIHNLYHYSDLVRSYVNTNVWRLFGENPILGLGAGGYKDWTLKYYGAEYYFYKGVYMNVHGEINRVPVESGIIGILIGSYCFFLLFRASIKLSVAKNTSKGRLWINYFCFIAIYCAFEALDTSMLIFILAFGLFLSKELQILKGPDALNLIGSNRVQRTN